MSTAPNKRGMKWSIYGHDFILDLEGTLTLVASESHDKDCPEAFRIHNPYGDIVVQSTHTLKRLQLSG